MFDISTWSDTWSDSQNYLIFWSVYLYIYLFWIRLIWLWLDGFESGGGATEMWILRRFLLMISSFLFACSVSFWWLQCRTTPIWCSIWFELNLFLSHSEFILIIIKNVVGQGQVSDQSEVASKRDVLVPGHHCQQLHSVISRYVYY